MTDNGRLRTWWRVKSPVVNPDFTPDRKYPLTKKENINLSEGHVRGLYKFIMPLL
jgi:hypothetical protein